MIFLAEINHFLKNKCYKCHKGTKTLLALFFLVFVLQSESRATHFRYGNVTWSHQGNNTVTFHITQAWRRSFAWNTPPVVGGLPVFTGNFFFGDSTSAPMNVSVTAVNLAENWFYGEATITHTYSGSGPWTAYFGSCCRISTLQNNNDGNFRVETLVDLSAANNSPISTLQPIVNLSTGLAAATFTIPAYDPDGNPIRYYLSTPTQMGDSNLSQPTGLTIDSLTGEVTWNTIGRAIDEMWCASVRICDGRGGIITLDFLIKIVGQSNPPYFNYALTPVNGFVYRTEPGIPLTFTVEALDDDVGDTVTLQAFGLPVGANMTPVLPVRGNPVRSVFSWTPAITDLGSKIVSFMAQDLSGNQTSTFVTIIVSTEPVFDSPPTPAEGSGFCIPTNVPYFATIQAHSPDQLLTVQITSAVIPASATLNPSLPTPASSITITELEWTPTPSDWGPNNLLFTVTDNLGNSASRNFSLVVNTSASFTSLPTGLVISENQPFVYNITVSDPDTAYGDELNILGFGIPSWLTLTDHGNGTATLSGTPGTGSAGSYPVHLDAEDIYHHCAGHSEQFFVIQVVSCNLSASIIPKPASVSGYCQGQKIELTASGGASYVWSTGETSQSIEVTASGAKVYSVTVTTGFCSATAAFSVVAFPNVPPVAVCKNTVAYLNTSGSAAITAADVDGGSRDNCGSITRTVLPASFLCANRGTNSVALTVTDTTGLSSSCNAIVTVIDSIKPIARCRNAQVVLNPSGNAILTASQLDNGSSDNCNFTLSVSPASFNCSNIGNNNVILTIADASGNSSSCNAMVTVSGQVSSSCNISSTANTIYLGYGAQSTVLSVTGISAVSYAWSPAAGLSCTNCPSPVFTPAAEGNYTITVRVTNSTGCISSCSITVCVLDVRVPGTDGQKIYVCHVLPNSMGGSHSLAVSINAVSSHFPGHIDDRLGRCEQSCSGSFKTDETVDFVMGQKEVKLYPNPFSDYFQLAMSDKNPAPVYLRVYDVAGKLIADYSSLPPAETLFYGAELSKGIYLAEVRQGESRKVVKMVKAD